MIRNAGRAGIPAMKYNFTVLGWLRTESTPGRGGASYSTLDLKMAKDEGPIPEIGTMDADRKWEAITHFLNRVVPVAEEHKVRLALHPFDGAHPRSAPLARRDRGAARAIACATSVPANVRSVSAIKSKHLRLGWQKYSENRLLSAVK